MTASAKSEQVTSYIAVGSNIAPRKNIARALDLLKGRVEVRSSSTFYRTKPLLRENQSVFYNGVWGIRTGLSPRELKFDVLRGIEDTLGRVRTGDPHAARTIDLDLILYGETVIDEPDLRIPDKDITTRAFIAVPLLELAPDLVIPGSNKKLSSLSTASMDGELEALTGYSEELRKRLTS